ncbi:hypothetical protein GQ457_18G005070 [Hibiscus cannabinus]
MTSRNSDVLKSMGSQKLFPIDELNEDEAWDLFKKVAGHIAERSDIRSTAKKVTKKCAGLPLAVTTVAKALKHKENLYEWEDALELLKPSEININGISGAVYSAIQLSYTYLETEERKSTFLLCSIMGHDAAIKDLLKYCRGLGLFPRLDTMEKVRNRVLSLVNKLKDSSLLLAGSTPERFGIHDVVRDVAISIASRDRCWLALGEEDVFEGWSNECTMRNYNLVRLHYAKVSELPDGLECPNLTFFSMNGTVEVPDNFFNRIPRLKVLEFVGTNLTALPSTIGYLKTLCTLCLIDCDLQDIVILGELRNLEILDLHGSAIVVLPDEIGQLNRLKLLDLNGCNNLQVVSPNVLSKLSNLEELYLYDFDKWEVEGMETPRSNASLVELQHLSRLTTLEIHIPNVKVMPNDNLFFGKMERYKISIGDDRWGSYYDEGMETSRMLKLKMNKSIVLVDGIKLLSRNAESLCLDGLKDVREILYDPNPESFRRLRFVKVKNCNISSNLFSFSIAKRLHQFEQLEVSKCKTITELNIEEETIGEDDILEFSQLQILKLHDLDRFNVLWYSKNTSQPAVFDKKVLCPALEKLKLDSVSDIKEIWHIDDGVPLRSFGVQSLTCLTVKGCHKLKYLFTSSMVKSFVQLKKLKVSRCDEMEEVIEERLMAREEEISSSLSSLSVFPKLDYLRLGNLPKLKRFCSGINPIEFSLLRHVIIQGCPDLKTLASDNGNDRTNISLCHSYLFNEKILCPVLEELKLDSMSGIEKIWHVDVQLPLMSFDAQSLTILEVRECHKLKNVFTSSMVKTFVQLKTLVVSDCNEMEEVIEGGLTTEKEGINNRSTRVFPKLDSLELGNLPRFKRFCCSSNSVEFLSLRSLKIWSCHILKTLIFDDENSRVSLLLEKVILPELEEVKIDNMENLERLWPDRLVEHSFSKLTSIHLRNCHKLLHVFPSMLARLHRLDRLSICDCKSVEEIIFDSQEEGNSSSMPQFIQFQCLTSLTLIRLPNLKSMHHKMHTLDWPSLKEMELSECDRVEILFASRGTIGGSSHHQPLFWVDESTFPNLQQLTLGWNAGIKESIQHCYGQQHHQLVSRYFRRLKVVKLVCYPEQVNMLPSYLFPWLSLPNLTLEISHSCFKEVIFPSEKGGEEKPAWLLLSQVTELRLAHLHELMHVWKENEGFQNLKVLHVEYCPKLKTNLVPSLVSFHNLVTLEVWGCDGIIKLITHPTAKSLEHLKEMSIRNCKNIEEIIQGGDDDDNNDDIRFSQLNRLKLEDLPKLECFSSENCTFEFPRMEILVLHDCPTMKVFSQQDSKTPMLHKVRINKWYEECWRWEGSLNSTIQQLSREKHVIVKDCEGSEEDQNKPSTSDLQHVMTEGRGNLKKMKTNFKRQIIQSRSGSAKFHERRRQLFKF